MGHSVGEIINVKGRIVEIVENEDGKFIRVRIKTTSGAQEFTFEEEDIENGDATP